MFNLNVSRIKHIIYFLLLKKKIDELMLKVGHRKGTSKYLISKESLHSSSIEKKEITNVTRIRKKTFYS
jgi:hypothetical protein